MASKQFLMGDCFDKVSMGDNPDKVSSVHDRKGVDVMAQHQFEAFA